MTPAVTFRPLQWDGPRTPDDQQRQNPFRAGFRATLDLLERELALLDAVDVVVEIDVAEGDLRRDGWPRASARPASPAVRLAFGSRHGPLVYATDSCATWQDNLRSIALGLEALRAVDRYGVTRRGEQYRGWAALPSAPDAVAFRAAAEVAADMVGADVDRMLTDPEHRRAVVAKAKRYAHPDMNAGNRRDWDRLVVAARTLGVPL